MKERINKLFMDLNEHEKLESECNYLERLSKYGSTIKDAENFVVWAIIRERKRKAKLIRHFEEEK